MKAIVDPSLLIKELKKINPVIGKNQVMPVLGCVKMDFEDKKLKVTGTNLNNWVSYTIPCEMKSNFSIVIEIAAMIEICGKAQGPMTIEAGEKFHKFKDDRATIKEPVSSQPKDFVNVEDVEYLDTVDVDGSFFHALAGAAVCMLRDPMRPHISAIGLDFKKDALTVIGIDGAIMHKQDFHIATKKPITVSVSSIFADLTKFFQESKLSVSAKFVKVEYAGAVVVSRLSESKFIDYNYALRDYKNEWNLTVNRKDLLTSIDIVDFATKNILFTLTPGSLNLFAEDTMIERQATADIPAQHDLDMKIAMDGKKLTSVLNTISDENICFGIKSHEDNIFIKPEDSDSILLGIMPLVINDLKQ